MVGHGDNLGEEKNPMTAHVVETGSSASVSLENGNEEDLAREEIKARMEAADLELKRIVPVVSNYPKLVGMLPLLGQFTASSLIISVAIFVRTLHPPSFYSSTKTPKEHPHQRLHQGRKEE